MQVIVIAKTNFAIVEYNSVTSITFANNIYTINGTNSYNANSYIVMIIN